MQKRRDLVRKSTFFIHYLLFYSLLSLKIMQQLSIICTLR